MRKYFIDNLRWLVVLLLFPYHTLMIYNIYENFYIKGDSIPLLNSFLVICYPWFMPLLFVIAGMSTCYALERRTPKQYMKERFVKLFIPLISGIVLLIPIQTFFAEKFHNGYEGGYIQQYILFFTKQSDLTGYTGGFTTGQLWFILYLLIISFIALPLILLYKRSDKKLTVEKFTIPKILPMFLIFLIMAPILDIGGKSVGEYFALFMLGYFVLSDDTVQERLEKNRWYLFGAAAIFTLCNVAYQGIIGIPEGIIYDILIRLLTWISILGLLGMGKHILNFRNKITDYFSKISFPVYLFHQSAIVLVAYYVFLITSNIVLQITLILCGSFILTMLMYELCKRTSITRFLFGIKK